MSRTAVESVVLTRFGRPGTNGLRRFSHPGADNFFGGMCMEPKRRSPATASYCLMFGKTDARMAFVSS
jgi:hypothetical protein